MLFQNLSKEQKVDFFVKCQEILVAHHPDSPFIFNEENVAPRLKDFKYLVDKYRGYAYQSDSLCVLYNRIKLKDVRNAAEELKENMYKEPSPNYNCFIIDFAVFDSIDNVRPFIESNYNPQIEYLIWVKNNEVKLYNAKNLIENLSRLARLPKISFV